MVQTDPKSSRSLDQNEYLQTGINVNTNIHLTALGCALGRMHAHNTWNNAGSALLWACIAIVLRNNTCSQSTVKK
jgi:hypothetical protein